MTQRTDSGLYPVALKLEGRRCLVVGGGAVALHKARELLRCGARLRAVAPAWPADFRMLDGEPEFSRSTRPFRSKDLDGIFLVVAATDDPPTQQAVARGAKQRGILCNVVDVNPLCNFYAPAILRRGALTVAVSTAGKSPLFAAAVRDHLAGLLPPALESALDRLGEVREMVRTKYPGDPERRRRTLTRLLTPQAIKELMQGRLDAFEAHWESWKSSLRE